MKHRKKIITGITAAAGLGLAAYFIYRAVQNDYFELIISLIDKSTPPVLFISLMLLLPAAGFPISIFLVLVGIKFGFLRAVLLWVLVVTFHSLVGYYLANALRKPMVRLLTGKMGYKLPEMPEKHEALYSFIFLTIPGIPYAAKNYLLPLAGVKFRYCVMMNTFSQTLLGIPFIILGKSAAEKNLAILLIASGIFAAGFLGIWWIEKRYGKKIL